MSAGKTKTIIDLVHYKSSEDPLRTVAGKYWSQKLGTELSIFKQGFDSEIGDSLDSPGAPFKIIFKDVPNRIEEEQFYEFEQKIVLKANSYRIAQEADPESAWGELIESITDEGAIYSDHAFAIDLPYSEKELKILNINQKVNTADIKPTYNFYIEGYEEKTVKQKIPEQILPNLYVFTQSEINGNTAYDVQDEDLDGLMSLGGQIPKTSQNIMKKRKNSLNEPTSTQDNNEKYFKNYGKHYRNFAKSSKTTLSRMKSRYSNISLTNDLVENIAEYNEKKYIFPMFSDIQFTTDSSTYVAQILKDAGLSTPLMNYLITMSDDPRVPRRRFVEARKKISTQKNKKLEKTAKMKTVFRRKSVATLDLLKWWDSYSSSKGAMDSTSATKAIMIGQEQAASDQYGRLRNAYIQHILETVFESKFRKFIKNYIRSYGSILNGDLSYSETIVYKIQKFLGNPVGTPIQTFYACNSNEVDILNILDTQVKYNTEYTYTITAHQLVLGTEYQYKDVVVGSRASTSAETGTTTDYYAKMTVVSRPSLKIIEVPIFAEKERIIDDPPVSPDINIIPYRAVNNRLLFNFMGNVGEYDLQPIFFNEEERLNYEKIRKAQKRMPEEPLRFSSDDPPAVFEVFRITKRPKSYMDFKGSKRVSVQTDISLETIQKASTASYVERLAPNMKYYYIFRSIDIHGHISYPSAVYEVQLVDDAGAVYPRISVVDFEPEIRTMSSKPIKKYMHIVPAIEQVLVNPEKSGLMNEYGEPIDSALDSSGDIQLGFQESPIWGKRFKIRLTSKQTGRKLDLNLRFEHEHIITEEDYKNEEIFREAESKASTTRGKAYYSSTGDVKEEQDELMELLE